MVREPRLYALWITDSCIIFRITRPQNVTSEQQETKEELRNKRISMAIIAFDVDGTLIDEDGQPREEVIALLKAFRGVGARVIVWSGGGIDYAQHQVERLFLKKYVHHVGVKGQEVADIVFDDQPTNMGRVDIQV